MPLNRVSEHLGHGDTKATLRHAHLATDNLIETVKSLDKPPVVEEVTAKSQRPTAR